MPNFTSYSKTFKIIFMFLICDVLVHAKLNGTNIPNDRLNKISKEETEIIPFN